MDWSYKLMLKIYSTILLSLRSTSAYFAKLNVVFQSSFCFCNWRHFQGYKAWQHESLITEVGVEAPLPPCQIGEEDDDDWHLVSLIRHNLALTGGVSPLSSILFTPGWSRSVSPRSLSALMTFVESWEESLQHRAMCPVLMVDVILSDLQIQRVMASHHHHHNILLYSLSVCSTVHVHHKTLSSLLEYYLHN